MDAELKVQEIFPTPLWIVDLDRDASARINRELLRSIHALTEPKPPLEVGGNWQTDPTLHEYEEFAEIIAIFKKAAKGALDFLQVDYLDFKITSCWANINPTGGKNSYHTHPNNYLSGVYYVAVPEGAGSIQFRDPRVQTAAILPPVKARNKYNGNNLTLPVEAGRLILFPAWLDHAVPVNKTADERVSISFNVMFTGFEETVSPTLWRKGSAPLRSD